MSSKVDDDKLNTVKTEIHCTLVSTRDGLTLKDFLRDYRETVGKPFPFASFGFKSPMDFIRSIPDVVTVSRRFDGAEMLLPIEKESSAHINKLVCEQKTTAKKGGGKLRTVRPRPVQLPNDRKPTEDPKPPQPRPPPGFTSQDSGPPMRRWEARSNVPPVCSIPNNLPPSFFSSGPGSYSPNFSGPPLPDWFDLNPTIAMTSHSLKMFNNYPPPIAQSLFQPQFQGHSHPSFPLQYNVMLPPEMKNEPNKEKVLIPNGESKHHEKVQHDEVNGEKNKEYEEDSPVDHNEHDESFYDDEDDSSSSHIGDNMKENFRKILKEHKNGVLCSKFPMLYNKKFGVPLNHNDLGFKSVKELVMACPDIFKIHVTKNKRGRDWILFDTDSSVLSSDDCSKWIPKQVLENMQELSLQFPKGIASEDITAEYKSLFKVPLDVKKLGFGSVTSFLVNCPSIECCTVDEKTIVYPVDWGKKKEEIEMDVIEPDAFLALKNVEFLWKPHFPSTVCDPTFKYDKFIIPSEKQMKAVVSDAVSPNLIFLQNASSIQDLDTLMIELNNFYDEEESNYKLNENMLFRGLACCTKFADQWHRALIFQPGDSEVKVSFVDYGTTQVAKVSELRLLHKKFSVLTTQAIRAELYNIVPVDKNGWSDESINFLFDSCLSQVFVAEIVNVFPEVPKLEVILCNTRGEEDILINDEFINIGYAVPKNRSTLASPTVPENKTQKEKCCINDRTHINSMSYPTCFLKLFPAWLSITDEWEMVFKVLEQAKCTYIQETGSANNLKNISNPPTCCTHHFLSHLFINKPRVFCDVWGRTLAELSGKIEHHFVKNLSNELSLPLNLLKGKRLCYLDEDASGNSYEDSNFNLRMDLRSPLSQGGLLTNRSNLYSDSNQSNYEANGYMRSSSISSLETIEDFSNTAHDQDSVKRSVIRARIGQKSIFFIRRNNGVYVIMNELLNTFVSIPPLLVRHRLVSARVHPNPLLITPKHEKLHAELVRNGIIEKGEQLSLVPLSQTPGIIAAVDPTNIYLVDTLKNMARDCTPDHSYWYV